ncbi:hypothetical protein OSTOST_19940, partial [Ostertagia ostertagi]
KRRGKTKTKETGNKFSIFQYKWKPPCEAEEGTLIMSNQVETERKFVQFICNECEVDMFEKRPAKLIYLTSNCYAFDQEGSDVVEEQPDQVPRQPVVRRFDLICFIFAMVTYVFDIISDIVTGIFHYYDG